MLQPLARLWRHPTRVLFYAWEGRGGQDFSPGRDQGVPQAMAVRRRFSSPDDAFNYLRYWSGQPDARAELKWILQRSGAALTGAYAGQDGWLRSLAGRMATGAVLVLEEQRQVGGPGRLVAPPSAELAADAIAALPLLSDMTVQSSGAAPVTQAAAAEADDLPMVAQPEAPASAADQLAQAETLETAAVTGVPFCEICETMRQQAQEAQNLQEAPESDDSQIAQAETFEQAAQQGTPFCEICESMKKNATGVPNE